MSYKPPAYQHYAKDFLAGTADMSCAEAGAYTSVLLALRRARNVMRF